MLNTNHPEDEVLSAHAAGDADTPADPSLAAHIASCERCGGVVRDLGMLRSALADLPDIAPHRPLRLIPAVETERAIGDGLAHWVRRLFAPALTAGAALAMVGLVGTALPSLEGMGASGAAQSAPSEASRALTAEDSASDGAEAEAANEATASDTIEFSAPSDAGGGGAITGADEATAEQPATEEAGTDLADAVEPERSPWPMVLFSGVAVMVAAALLRWILAAPAG